MQDSPRRWAKLVAASVALVDFAALDAVEAARNLARRAVDKIREAVPSEPFETGILGRELLVESGYRVPWKSRHSGRLQSVAMPRLYHRVNTLSRDSYLLERWVF